MQPVVGSAARRQVWAAHEVAKAALRTLAEPLSRHRVPVVPVKGLLLGHTVYSDQAERPIRDVDLLVSRGALAACRAVMAERTYKPIYSAPELGLLAFEVLGVHFDLHAEFGARDLTALTTDDVIARARPSRHFDVETLQIDDVDHFLLLAVNVVKDGFHGANSHQPEDLRRVLDVLRKSDRIAELIERTRQAGFTTGLYAVASWMADEHDSVAFTDLLPLLRPRRIIYSTVIRGWRSLPAVPPYVGMFLGCLSNDRAILRARAFGRLARRATQRALGIPRP